MALIERIMAGEVLVDIGQIDAATKRALARLVKTGQVAKWRGHWFPVAGASFGMGPLKTCYGLPEVQRIVQWK